MSTRIIIHAEGIVVTCPHCEAEIDEIMVHREYEMTQPCSECFEDILFQVVASAN